LGFSGELTEAIEVEIDDFARVLKMIANRGETRACEIRKGAARLFPSLTLSNLAWMKQI
jgi:hypothetical protein